MFTSPRQNDKSKQNSFITQLTSDIEQSEGAQSMISMLSPRNLMKYVATAIDDYSSKPKVYKRDRQDEKEFLGSFDEYWGRLESEYKRYLKLKNQKIIPSQKQQRNEQIQFKLKLQRIPQSYFDDKYQLFFTQKFNKLALKRKQDQTAEYLDEIELLLWSKTSKNPEKFFNCIDNFDETIDTVQKSLKKVKKHRQETHKKLLRFNKSQLRIKSIYLKKQRIEQTLNHLQCIKKIKQVKEQSAESFSSNWSEQKQNGPHKQTFQSRIKSKLQILQNIKKKQLQVASKITSLSKMVNNLQFYRQQIKNNIYEQFNQEIVELMGKLLAYDKNAWQNTKVSPQMLGKQQQKHANVLQQSRLNITILDQSCFSNQVNYSSATNPHNDDQIEYKNPNPNSQTVKSLLIKLNSIWDAIVNFDLYDEEEINELIMRELVRHNVMWNKDLEQYLNRLFDRFENAQKIASQNMKPILQEEFQHEEDDSRSKEISSTEEASQQLDQKFKSEQKPKGQMPKKNNYFSSITQMAGINDIKNLKDLSKLKNKTINTFKRFGNMKKIGQVITGASQVLTGASQALTGASQVLSGASQSYNKPEKAKDSYCKLKENQIPQKQQVSKKQKLSQVDTRFFLKAVKFYYQILSNMTKFIKQNERLLFFRNFLQKLNSFIQERVKFFFSLRHINENTSVPDFLLYLNLIQYWADTCDDVYENLSHLKSTVTDQYLTALQKNALVNELKRSIEESNYLPLSISSAHINSFYYVFFWSSLQQLKQHQANNMSLTILKDEPRNSVSESASLMQGKSSDFKIIDKRIVCGREEFFVCDSFLVLIKQLEKYLQLREVLVGLNSNIQEKICEVVGFYVWYNMKNINKTGPAIKPKTLKNLCNIHSTISFLKVIFTQQLKLSSKKYPKTLEQFSQFFKSLDNSIMMTPYFLVQQQISLIYQNSAMTQFQIPCKETVKILEIVKLSLEELKLHFVKEKILKMLQPTVKVIIKNYFGYLASLGKRGLLEIKEFLPKYKELLLNFGFKRGEEMNDIYLKEPIIETHIFLKEITQMEKNFKSKVSQMK